MTATFNEVIDIFHKWDIALGTRAARATWMNMPIELQEKDLANFNRDLETVKSFINLLRYENALGEPPTCSICKNLNVINNNELYALCKKTGTIFEPFELDARKHYCTCFKRKEN